MLRSALSSPDSEHLASTLVLLSIHAPAVRELLEKDEQFRNEFFKKWWPIFSQKLEQERKNDELWGIAIHDPRIWTFLNRFKERGAAAWQGWDSIAIELLLDEHYASCRDQIFAALEKGDYLVMASLLDEGLRAEPLFISLLQRGLPAGTLAKALHVLQSRHAEAPALLDYWARLSNQALIEELGPPPEGVQTWLPGYYLYYLVKKWSQGRNTNAWDWTSALLDATFLALEIGPVFNKAVPPLVQQGARGVAEASAEQLVREAGPWGLRQLFHSMIEMLAKRTAQTMTIDITQAVRLAFGKSGLGRSTFKRLTGLEARVFMRADRRVVIDLLSLVNAKHPVGVYLRETAINAGFEQIEDSKVVQGAITKAAETIADAGKQLQAWKAHAAAWWLAVNHDVFGSEG
ncbi:MAG: hypothetical protein ACUVTH_09310 [Thermogutta sp.]